MPETYKLSQRNRRVAPRKGARPFPFARFAWLGLAAITIAFAAFHLLDTKNLWPGLLPIANAEGLVGLTAASTTQLLGQPQLKRQEDPAEIWQYRSGRCVLDLYLYGPPSEQKVQHAELRGQSKLSNEIITGQAATKCLDGLKKN